MARKNKMALLTSGPSLISAVGRGIARRIKGTPQGLSIAMPVTVHEWAPPSDPGGGASTDYSTPFRRHPLIFRAISVIAEAGGAVDLRLSRMSKSGERIEITSGVEYETLMNPSPEISTDMLISQILGFMQMACGEAFVYVSRSGNKRQLSVVNPGLVAMERLDDGTIKYEINKERVDASEIIHFKRAFNPYDDLRGIGPLQAASLVYRDDFDVRRYNADIVTGGGVPAGFVSFANGEWPTDDQMKQFKDAVDKAQKSKRKIIGIGGGTWQAAGMSAEEMAFLETRKLSFREIGGVFGVPPSKLGDYERDQADAMVQKLDFWDTTMISQLRLIADILRINMWKISGTSMFSSRDIIPYFDFSEVPELMQRERDLRKSDRDDLMAGLTTINRILKRRNEDTVPWGDVWWKPMGLAPVDSAESPDIDPNSTVTDAPLGGDDTYTPPVPKKHANTTKSVDVTGNLVWMAFALRTGGFEDRLAAAIRDVLGDIEQDVLRNLGVTLSMAPGISEKGISYSSHQILFDISEAIKKIAMKSRPIITDAVDEGGTRGLRLARVRQAFDVDAREAENYIRQQTQRFAIPVTENTWKRLQSTLAEGFSNGETERELTDRVRYAMSVRRADAARTARTEASAAMNGGVSLGFEQSEVVETKLWITAGDEKVRTEPDGGHVAANEQERAVDEPFDVGGEQLMFPGDPSASAFNVCECRCTLVPGKIVRS